MEENKKYILTQELSNGDCSGVSGGICVFFECSIGLCSYTKCENNNVIYLLKDEKCV